MLGSVLPGIAAEPAAWGKPVNGVRMALSYLASGGIIEITFENTTAHELFLPLGYLGTGADALRLVVTAGKNTEQVTFTGTSRLALPPDQQFPMLVPLLPLRAELNPVPGPALPKLKCFPSRYIWTGSLISNVVEVS